MVVSTKVFFPNFPLKMLFFSKKLLDEKIFETSFLIKTIIFIFVTKRPLPFKRNLASRNCFLPFPQKIQLFFEKTAK